MSEKPDSVHIIPEIGGIRRVMSEYVLKSAARGRKALFEADFAEIMCGHVLNIGLFGGDSSPKVCILGGLPQMMFGKGDSVHIIPEIGANRRVMSEYVFRLGCLGAKSPDFRNI